MKEIAYSEIDSGTIFELECRNGMPDGIELSGVPQALAEKIQNASAGTITPDEFKSFLSITFYGVNSDASSSRTLRIIIRFISRGFACLKLKRSVFGILLGEKELFLRLKCCEGVGPYTKALLAVDLGNTRTCALVCPDIGLDIGNFKMERLELASHYGSNASEGIWDSLCVIGKSKVYGDVSPSFVRLGMDNDLYLRDGNVLSEGTRSLSTPKRYFWDCDSNRSWHVIYPGSKDEYLLEDQRDIELADYISREHYQGKHPRAMILEGMIFELLEQAERMLNHESGFLPGNAVKNAAVRQRRTYITQLAMTYPAAWSPEEVAKYREVIQRGVDCYVSQRCRNIPIELQTSCNEAVAVMVNYIYSETLRFGSGPRWLALFGKASSLDNHRTRTLRIGVIDIGGGTSDLAIAEVSWKHVGRAIDIVTLYTSGTNEAGDAMIALIIKNIIFDKVFEKLVDLAGDENKGKRDELKAFLGREVAPKLKSLTRSFWFPLAIKFLEETQNSRHNRGEIRRHSDFVNITCPKCGKSYDIPLESYDHKVAHHRLECDCGCKFLTETEEEESFSITIYDPNKPDDALSRGFRSLHDAFVEKTDTADDRIQRLGLYIKPLPGAEKIEAADDEPAKRKPPESIKIVFEGEDLRKFQTVLGDNFRSSPKIFGAAISAYRCDLMIWSGKTADNPAIRKLFEDQMPVPPEASISMNDYRISNEKFPLTHLDGRLSDSKLATAVGAALYQLLKDDNNLRITADYADDANLLWGLKDAAGCFMPLFDGDSPDSRSQSYNGKPLIIYRANSNSPFAFPLPAYEFRRKPGLDIDQVNITFTLSQRGGGLDFTPEGGSYLRNGEQREFRGNGAKEDFELRIRTTDADEIWLDSGNII